MIVDCALNLMWVQTILDKVSFVFFFNLSPSCPGDYCHVNVKLHSLDKTLQSKYAPVALFARFISKSTEWATTQLKMNVNNNQGLSQTLFTMPESLFLIYTHMPVIIRKNRQYKFLHTCKSSRGYEIVTRRSFNFSFQNYLFNH